MNRGLGFHSMQLLFFLPRFLFWLITKREKKFFFIFFKLLFFFVFLLRLLHLQFNFFFFQVCRQGILFLSIRLIISDEWAPCNKFLTKNHYYTKRVLKAQLLSSLHFHTRPKGSSSYRNGTREEGRKKERGRGKWNVEER